MKKYYKKNYKNIYKKMDLRISLLNFNFAMIYIIHKVLRLIKDNIFELFFKKYNRLLFFKIIFFFS